MMQVPGGYLTAEKLATEIINQISHVKKLHNNAKDNIVNEINLVRKSLATSPEDDASYRYKKLHDQLQVLSHFSSLFGLFVIHKIKWFSICSLMSISILQHVANLASAAFDEVKE